jgi:hypothetical protein
VELDIGEGVLCHQEVSEGCVLLLLFEVFVLVVSVATVSHFYDVESVLKVYAPSEVQASREGVGSRGGFFQAFDDEEVGAHAPEGVRWDLREEPFRYTFGLDLRGKVC